MVSLKVFNAYGMQLASIIDLKNFQIGKYIESFDLKNRNLPTGLYYFDLQIDQKRIIKKIIYTK